MVCAFQLVRDLSLQVTGRPRPRGPRTFMLVLIVLGASGCLPAGRYAEVSFSYRFSDPYVANLAWDASRRNPRAQVELGQLYEGGGRGLRQSLVCAKRLYEAAASGERGLPEAKAKLAALPVDPHSAADKSRARCDDVAEQTRWFSLTDEEQRAELCARHGACLE